jgi:hypothetical protein
MSYKLVKQPKTTDSLNRRLKQLAITLSGRLQSNSAYKTPTGNAGKQLHFKYAVLRLQCIFQ